VGRKISSACLAVEPSVGAGIFPDKPKCVGGEKLGDVSKDLLTHTVGKLKRDRSGTGLRALRESE